MVRKWSTVPISLSCTTPFPPQVAVVEAAWPALWEYTSDAWVAQHAGDTKYRNGKKGKRFRAWAPGWKETVPAALSPAQVRHIRVNSRTHARWA
jgi:hypothetical protein